MITYWLSFRDPSLPRGQQFLGVILVDLTDEELSGPAAVAAVVKETWKANINPGGQILTVRFNISELATRAREKLERLPRLELLDRQQLNAYGVI